MVENFNIIICLHVLDPNVSSNGVFFFAVIIREYFSPFLPSRVKGSRGQKKYAFD